MKWKILIGIAIVVIAYFIVAELDRQTIHATPSYYYSNIQSKVALFNYFLHCNSAASVKGKSILRNPTADIFPHIQMVRDLYPILKQESVGAIRSAQPIKNEMFFEKIADDRWKRIYLKWYTPEFDEQALRLYPKTCKVLSTIPEVKLAMISILEPGAFISAHHGVFKGCLRYHLGISTPNDDKCFIEVDGEKYSWRDGEDVMFDDTFQHSVANNTDQTRVILFLDVERPMRNTFARSINSFCINKIAPWTTRSNNKQEKVEKQR